MDEIRELFEIDFPTFIITLFVILAAVIAMVKIIEELSKIVGRPVKWIKKRDKDHEHLMQTMDELKKLETRYEEDTRKFGEQNAEVRNNIKKLTDMFLDKEISDMRWEIISFATRISDGKHCNKESFTHCLKVYEHYEKLLDGIGMENGEVNISMKVITDAYEEKLKNGF